MCFCTHVDTGDLLKDLVDIGQDCAVQISVPVHLEAIGESTLRHFHYGISHGFELALNLGVIPITVVRQ